jgi:hypothetical protein
MNIEVPLISGLLINWVQSFTQPLVWIKKIPHKGSTNFWSTCELFFSTWVQIHIMLWPSILIDCELFHRPDLDILILSSDCSIDMIRTHTTLTDFDCRVFHWPDLGILILTSDCSIDMILTVECSFTWPGHTDFDCGLFLYLIWTCCLIFHCWLFWLPDLDMKLTAAVNSRQGMLTPPTHLIPQVYPELPPC